MKKRKSKEKEFKITVRPSSMPLEERELKLQKWIKILVRIGASRKQDN